MGIFEHNLSFDKPYLITYFINDDDDDDEKL